MSGERLRIGFSGDLGFYGAFAAERSPEARFAPAVTDFLRGHHHNVLNVEGPVTAVPERRGIGPTLRSPPQTALPALRHLRCGVANLANNHTMDCGAAGLAETLEHLAHAGIQPLGAGPGLHEAAAPVVVEGEGIRVGLLAVCDPSGTPAGEGVPGVLTHGREALVRERLAELRRTCDWVVLSYHGGEEYTFEPMPARRRRLLRYLGEGADVVVAHHAHVVQGWETTPRGVVFYGLGNFVLDHPVMRHRPGTYDGVLLRLSFGADDVAWEPCYVRSDPVADRVDAGPPLAPFAPLAARGRRARWCREAHRVRTLPRPAPAPAESTESTESTGPAPSSTSAESTRSAESAAFAESRAAGESRPAEGGPAASPSGGRVGARIRRVRGLFQLARTWNYRPVVLGDLEHRVRRVVGLAASAEDRGAEDRDAEDGAPSMVFARRPGAARPRAPMGGG